MDINVAVHNSGDRDGKEIVQIYADLPAAAEAPRRLVGWVKVDVPAGTSRSATIHVPSKYLSVWSSEHKQWVLARGAYGLEAAASSRDIQLHTTINVSSEVPDDRARTGRP